jgi:hypothetical protein
VDLGSGLPAAEAQQVRLSIAEIGAMAREAVRVVLPEGTKVSGAYVADRDVIFDDVRTLMAFGYDSTTVHPRLVPSAVTEGNTIELFAECDSGGMKPCTKFGDRVVVRMQPISTSDRSAKVMVMVSWADRSGGAGRAIRVGFARELYFERAADGTWRFSGFGKTIVG